MQGYFAQWSWHLVNPLNIFPHHSIMFKPNSFIQEAEEEIKSKLSNKKAISAISGGVDSLTATILAHQAVGDNIIPISIDTGLLRKGEVEYIKRICDETKISVKVIDKSDLFLSNLEGVSDPETKRKIIGNLFIECFDEIATEFGAEYLIQGTIAPDWIESGGMGRNTIKSHHNVGGLPKDMKLKLIEPMRELYKHEVRMVADILEIPEEMYNRQPFPGPGLAVRVIGEITKGHVQIVRDACAIVEGEIETASKEGKMEIPWQYFAALLPTKTVGVRGDERSYQYTITVRAIKSLDGMTASFSHIPPEVLQKISTRITNEITSVGRVLYDITNKPPGTIEYE